MEIFKIENLNFKYQNQAEQSLRNINLSINQGDFFVICGNSGSGKTTLLRSLKQTLTPNGEQTGTILFEGKKLTEHDLATQTQIGFVMQSPENQIVTDKVWHELAFGLENLGLDNKMIRQRCSETATFFGIEKWYYKNVCDLSGGEKQLLCIASIMAMHPKVLILDEPTAQLDPISASELFSILGKINRELGTTIVLSEHRLEEPLALANKAAVMKNGELSCVGSVKEVGEFLKNQNDQMFSAMPTAMQIWGSVESKIDCPISVKDGREFLLKYTKNHQINPLIKTNTNCVGTEMINIKDVCFRYEQNEPNIIRSLDFKAKSGEIVCILGGNGSGKTTMLKLISGIQKPQQGEINLGGKIGLLPQNPQIMFLKNTVKEDLIDTLKQQKIASSEWDSRIEKIAKLCNIIGLLNRNPYDLSGGEISRTALAKVLLKSPDILLLDEPTKGLDAPFKKAFAQILYDLKKQGKCIIIVSHDIDFCANYADRCGMFFDGRVDTVATPTEFFSQNNFYTTSANRIAREIEPTAVTTDDVIKLIGGKINTPIIEKETEFQPQTIPQTKPQQLKTPRKIGAIVSGLCAIATLIVGAYQTDFTKIANGSISNTQLILCGIFLVCMILCGAFLYRKQERKSLKKEKLKKRTVISIFFILFLIPLTLFISTTLLDKKQYYITALLVLIECMLPFFVVFEKRKPKARELVLVATLCAIAIAGRAMVFMLPQVKPVMAVVIITGIALGSEKGFMVGAVTMLVSNMIFSQGPWTAWQMFAMGLVGFLAGLFRNILANRSKIIMCIFAVISAIVVYGGIVNPVSVLVWGSETLNLKMIIACYLTGFPLDVVHGISTAVFLWFGAEPMLQKLERVKIKYGI